MSEPQIRTRSEWPCFEVRLPEFGGDVLTSWISCYFTTSEGLPVFFTTATRDTKACEGGRGSGGGTGEGWVAVFRRWTVFFLVSWESDSEISSYWLPYWHVRHLLYLPPALQWLVFDWADKIVVLQEEIVIGFSEPEISEGSLPGSAPVSQPFQNSL